MKADICIFACTGHVGAAVARRLVELAPDTDESSPSMTLLLAGRNIAKVREVRAKLLAEMNRNHHHNTNNVNIVAHSESVDVADNDALLAMVSRARVVANCIDLDSHPRALEGVAEACAEAGVHYVDLAARCNQLESLFGIKPTSKSMLVPASGFDFAFVDVAVLQAERAFSARDMGVKPDRVQITLALRTGPLGIKVPLRLVKKYLESESKSTQHHPSAAPSRQKVTQRSPERSVSSVLAYIKPLSSWSIRWPLGADSVTFLLCQRQWTPGSVDARIALPRTLWKAALLAVYGLAMAILFIPLLITARYLKSATFHKLLLWLLPIVTLGFLCNDDDLCRISNEQMQVELVVTLKKNNNSRGPQQSLCYHVVGPSPEILNPLCLALSTLELAMIRNNDGSKGSVSTPAMAMGETDFWSRLQAACDLKVQMTDSSSCNDGQ